VLYAFLNSNARYDKTKESRMPCDVCDSVKCCHQCIVVRLTEKSALSSLCNKLATVNHLGFKVQCPHKQCYGSFTE